MNMIRKFVETQITECERKAIITDYDEWSYKGYIGESVLRYQAKMLGIHLYGEHAEYCASVTTGMKDLYNAVCRYYADQYLLNHNSK